MSDTGVSMATRNHRFRLKGDEVKSEAASAEEIERARAAFSPAIRSCWECNHAHQRFLHSPEGFSFWCYQCGRYYSNGIDVTDYGAPMSHRSG